MIFSPSPHEFVAVDRADILVAALPQDELQVKRQSGSATAAAEALTTSSRLVDDAMGPRMLAKTRRNTGLRVEDLIEASRIADFESRDSVAVINLPRY